MEVRELVATLGLRFSPEAFNAADRAIEKLKGGLGLSAAAVTAMGAAVASTMSAIADASELKDMQDAYGVSTNALQEMGFAAKLSGAGVDEVRDGLRFLSRNAVEAAGGSKEASAAFKKLGIDVKDSSGHIKGADALMMEMSDGLLNIENPAERTAVALQLLGRGGGPLLAFLGQGSKGIRELRQEAIAMGMVFDTDFVEAADAFGDNMDRIGGWLTGFRNAVAKAFLPIMQKLQTALLDWFKTNGSLMQQRLANYISGIANILGVLVGGVSAVIGAITGIIQWFWQLGSMMQTIMLVAGALALTLLAPWIAYAAAIGIAIALLDDFFVFFQGGDSLLGQWIDKMATDGGIVTRSLASILEMARGLFRAFNEGGFSALWDEWTQALFVAQDAWTQAIAGFFNWLVTSWRDADDAVARALADFGAAVVDFFAQLGAQAWAAFANSGIGKFLLKVGGGVSRAFTGLADSGIGRAVSSIGADVTASLSGSGSATAPGLASSSSIVNAPRVAMDIKVTAAPGQDAGQVADAVSTQVEDYFSTQLRSLVSALTPAGAE